MTTVLGVLVFGIMSMLGLGFALLIAFVFYLFRRVAVTSSVEEDGAPDLGFRDRPQIASSSDDDCGCDD